MLDDWTAEVVGRMHAAHISGGALAAEAGYSPGWLSTVLNDPSRGTKETETNIFAALERLEQAVKEGTPSELP